MKALFLRSIAVLVSVGLSPLAAAAADCGPEDIIANRRQAIQFQTFDSVNPETGARYHPNDLIDVTRDGGTTVKVRAAEYFQELNDTETTLNQWGYSLRESGTPTLARLNYCLERLEKQAAIIDATIREEEAKFLENPVDWAKRWQMAREEYARNTPSWEELYRTANNQEYRVYMPTQPVYQPPRPQLPPREIAFQKEKSYNLYKGSNKDFSVAIIPYYKIGATKVSASGEAGVKVNGGLVGKWEGEIATIKLNANSPASGPLTVDIVASVINGRKTWSKPLVKLGSLRYYDNVRASAAHEVTYRFAAGPVPLAATVGLRGEAGFQWGIDLFALQVGAFTGPYAAVDAYAQIGADIIIAGAGVGGRLRMAEYSLNLQGSCIFNWVDEPEITLSMALVSDLTLLAGDLYAFAYVRYPVLWPPFIKRKEWKFTLFAWHGYRKVGTLFDYRARYGRPGLVVEGDAAAEDILDPRQAQREAYVEELERMADAARDRLPGIIDWLDSDANTQVERHAATLTAVAATQKQKVAMFWQQVE